MAMLRGGSPRPFAGAAQARGRAVADRGVAFDCEDAEAAAQLLEHAIALEEVDLMREDAILGDGKPDVVRAAEITFLYRAELHRGGSPCAVGLGMLYFRGSSDH
ncbi:hypothetical protein [Burkholderia pseudomallei]|uniref:hypothetical protein n=1 Tax=Burkholderia pseudomallei TaxID=28450 RepID=UPI00155F8AAF